jgi:hypothetical protein
VRLLVAMKNVGKPQYAFNNLQTKLLPRLYQPPPSTTVGPGSTELQN